VFFFTYFYFWNRRKEATLTHTETSVGKTYILAVRFASAQRSVFAAGLNVSADHRTIENYEMVECNRKPR
jgi:hypothetical protein